MVKYYCDCCLKEAKHLNSFEYLCHLEDIFTGKMTGYVDGDMTPISGRVVEKNFCHKCYNKIVSKAVQEFYLNRMINNE
jgi:hypothetical protein